MFYAEDADRLGDGQDVIFVEAFVEGGSTMSRRAEFDLLCGDRWIRNPSIIGFDQVGNVDQHFLRGQFSCKWAYLHVFDVPQG